MDGPASAFCKGKPVVTVDPASCNGSAGAGGGEGGETGGMAGAAGMGAAGGSSGEAGAAGSAGSGGDCQSTGDEYGPIQYGGEGDDDDCKYHVKWSATPVALNQDFTLTLTLTTLADGKPVSMAEPMAEIFFPCDTAHPPPSLDFSAKSVETSPGTYTIGPVQLDRSGHWAVRFHVFDSCVDGETSPHGHAAFYLGAP